MLSDEYPDSSQVAQLGLERADDLTIWRYAADHQYTLVTKDSDFAELASVLGPPPKLIWLRCGNQPSLFIAEVLRGHSHLIRALSLEDLALVEIY